MSEWHYSKSGTKHGPISSQKLKELAAAGAIHPTDLIWRDGMADWQPASKVKGLFPPTTEPKIAVPPPLPPSAATVEPPPSKSLNTWLTDLKRSKPRLIAVIVLAFWIMICVIKFLSMAVDPANWKAPQAAQAVVPISLTVDPLYSAYRGNSVGADRMYKGKTITVLGKVHSVKSMTLVGVTIFMAGQDDPGIRLGCVLSGEGSKSKDLDSLQSGDYVKVTGICEGADIAGTVSLKDCTFTVAASQR